MNQSEKKSSKPIDALAAHGRESIKETRQKLDLALRRLAHGNPLVVKKGTKISASSVSLEAGIDRATLYRFHEPILTEIRKINDTEPKQQLKDSRTELSETNVKLKEYRALVEEAQEEVAALARINYRLDARISELEGLMRIRDDVIDQLQKQINAKPKVVDFAKIIK